MSCTVFTLGLLGGAAPLGLSGVPLGHNVPLGGIDNWLFPGVAEVTHSHDYMVTMVVPKDTSTKHFDKNVLLDEPTLRLVKISTKRFDSPTFRQTNSSIDGYFDKPAF